jgi:hypothetical protein
VSLAAVFVLSTRLFAIDPSRSDDLHVLRLGALHNLLRVVGLVSHKSLDYQSIEQPGHRFKSCRYPRGQYKAQRLAQGVANIINFGIEHFACDAYDLQAAGLAPLCPGLVRPASGRVDHHFAQVGLLHVLEKTVEIAFASPVGVTLVYRAPLVQPLRQVAPSGTCASHPQPCIEILPLRLGGATFAVAWAARYAGIAHR